MISRSMFFKKRKVALRTHPLAPAVLVVSQGRRLGEKPALYSLVSPSLLNIIMLSSKTSLISSLRIQMAKIPSVFKLKILPTAPNSTQEVHLISHPYNKSSKMAASLSQKISTSMTKTESRW